ncbi:MAG TPA: glycosyltransferase [Candidatus Limnocylindrales bacterium]|nr:glycosyltransferase [Candidatus Limnocylindrales bacterium]
MITISVVIPSYNSEQTIRSCLEAILKQKPRGAFEVLVVDSSTDSTPDIIRREFPTVKLIHLDEKADPGTARNLGVKEAQGRLIAFVDSDCIAASDWLLKMEEAHTGDIVAVGGSIDNGNPHSLISRAGYLCEFRDFLPGIPKQLVQHIATGNSSYQKSVLVEKGGFFGEFQEDLLFNWRLSQEGKKILFDPTIQVHHFHRTHLKDYLKHQYKIGRTTVQVLKKTDLQGSFIVRHPVLAAGILPVLPFVKFIRTIYTFIKFRSIHSLGPPLVIPLFCLGLFSWALGFASGVYGSPFKIKGEDKNP